MVIGWTPNDGPPPGPGEQARRAFFMAFALLAALSGVVGVARFPVLFWVAVPAALVAAALLLWPNRR